MKYILLGISLFILLLTSGISLAESRGEILAQLKERVAQIQLELGLTDEQVAQMRPILERSLENRVRVLESHGIEFGKEAANNDLSFREKRKLGKDLKAVREQTMEELSAVLSKEQLEAYEEMSDARRKEMRERAKARQDN